MSAVLLHLSATGLLRSHCINCSFTSHLNTDAAVDSILSEEDDSDGSGTLKLRSLALADCFSMHHVQGPCQFSRDSFVQLRMGRR